MTTWFNDELTPKNKEPNKLLRNEKETSIDKETTKDTNKSIMVRRYGITWKWANPTYEHTRQTSYLGCGIGAENIGLKLNPI